jgi:hypothetical protein
VKPWNEADMNSGVVQFVRRNVLLLVAPVLSLSNHSSPVYCISVDEAFCKKVEAFPFLGSSKCFHDSSAKLRSRQSLIHVQFLDTFQHSCIFMFLASSTIVGRSIAGRYWFVGLSISLPL